MQPIRLVRGKYTIPNVGVLEVYTPQNYALGVYQNIFDAKKVPKGAMWRFRKVGDVFETTK
jgi:hypothetical protein